MVCHQTVRNVSIAIVKLAKDVIIGYHNMRTDPHFSSCSKTAILAACIVSILDFAFHFVEASSQLNPAALHNENPTKVDADKSDYSIE